MVVRQLSGQAGWARAPLCDVKLFEAISCCYGYGVSARQKLLYALRILVPVEVCRRLFTNCPSTSQRGCGREKKVSGKQRTAIVDSYHPRGHRICIGRRKGP
jgi:hypothetical protein